MIHINQCPKANKHWGILSIFALLYESVFSFQRLTRSLPGEQRDTVLQAYISNDVLERYSNKQVGPQDYSI